MNDRLPTPRRYSDREVRRLLQRATELQQADAAAPESTGLTLDQLEAVAREAGIDPAALRRAADELEARAGRGSERGAALAGAPLTTVLEQTLPVEASPATMEALIPTIQQAAGVGGQLSLVGRTLSWQSHSRNNPRELLVTVASRDGQTRIRVEERYGGLAGLVFGSGMGGIGAGVGVGVGVGVGASIGSVLMMVGFPLAVLGATYTGGRALFRSLVRRRRDVLRRMISTLSEAVMAAATERREESLPGPDSPAPG